MIALPVIDGHIDIAWNYTALGRRFEDPVKVKHKKDKKHIVDTEGYAAVGFPEAKSGNVRLIFGTIWVESEKSVYPTAGKKYKSYIDAQSMAINQLDYYKLLNSLGIQLVVTTEQLIDILFSKQYQIGIVPLIEGADFIRNKNDLDFWYSQGIRIIAPVWQRNQYAGCSELGGGLTYSGQQFIRCLEERKIIIDIAHMSDESAEMTFEQASGIVINSHTACRHFVRGERQINDRQIVHIHQRGGVIGIMTWCSKLKSNKQVTTSDYVDHIAYIADLTGCMKNVAIGSSMDGGYGVESLPKGMKNIESLETIADEMIRRNFSEQDVRSVLYNNWCRVLQSTFDSCYQKTSL